MNKSTIRRTKQQLRKAVLLFSTGSGSAGEADGRKKGITAALGTKKPPPGAAHSECGRNPK